MSGRGALLLALLAALDSSCAATRFEPRLVARGELTLRYGAGGFSMREGGKEVAHGPAWSGLGDYVKCVTQARALADAAASQGRAGIAMSVLGTVFGLAAPAGIAGFALPDDGSRWGVVGAGVGSGLLGLTFGILSIPLRNGANGRAVDAMNLYNDAVGSLGATCEDLRYPAPVGPLPPTSP